MAKSMALRHYPCAARRHQSRDAPFHAGHTEPMPRLLALPLVVACATCVACAGAAQRPRIERADQLPSHRYPLTGPVGDLVVDAAAFARLAAPLRADMESDLARYDIREPESLKDHLFILALLDALDNRWPAALARIDQIAAVET